jgi:hypothetical protein
MFLYYPCIPLPKLTPFNIEYIVLSQYSSGGSGEYHTYLSQDSWYPGWDSNEADIEFPYKATV